MLLTVREAASYLRIDRKALRRMPIPCVMLGKRKVRYRREDLDKFVSMHILYPQKEVPSERRISSRPKAMGLSSLPTWKEVQAIQMAHKGGRAECI